MLHAGRIDALALSEEDNPVIIEYKKVESSELINQSLYYLNWIQDHKGDFEIAVQKWRWRYLWSYIAAIVIVSCVLSRTEHVDAMQYMCFGFPAFMFEAPGTIINSTSVAAFIGYLIYLTLIILGVESRKSYIYLVYVCLLVWNLVAVLGYILNISH